MPRRKDSYKYLLSLYKKIDVFINEDKIDSEEIPDMVVSFCTVAERIDRYPKSCTPTSTQLIT